MARDGFLPRRLQGKAGKPPIGAVMLQGAIALFLVLAYQLGEVLNNVGAILTLFSAMTVFSLFWIRFRKTNRMRPDMAALVAGFFYLILSGVMLYFGFKKSPTLNLWVGASILTALIGYFVTRKRVEVLKRTGRRSGGSNPLAGFQVPDRKPSSARACNPAKDRSTGDCRDDEGLHLNFASPCPII